MKILNRWVKKVTKDYTEIPLMWMCFNYQSYINNGAKGSCVLKLHPDLKGDEKLKQMMEDVVDYIRGNYDMERFTKI